MHKITYNQGSPSDFALDDRWVNETGAADQFQADNRPKLELIGEIIASVASYVDSSSAAIALQASLLSGTIKSSGRFSAIKWTDTPDQISVPFRARIPPTEFMPSYNGDHAECVSLIFDYEDNGYHNEWSEFNWLGSSVKYAAHGFYVCNDGEEFCTLNRWTVSWTSIMILRSDAMAVLGKINPFLRPISRPQPVRSTKSDAEIIAKADEMRLTGLKGTDIARMLKHEIGFENVQNSQVRQMLAGRYKRGPRPKF